MASVLDYADVLIELAPGLAHDPATGAAGR